MAIEINTAVVGKKKKKEKNDISEIICYNCNKKEPYSDAYPKPQKSKTSIGLDNLHVNNWSKKGYSRTYPLYLLFSLVQEGHYRGPDFDQFKKRV